MANRENSCLRCGAALGAAAIEGFCPGCLATAAFRVDDSGANLVQRQLGRRLGSYELLAEIGRGGMGVVYHARQIDLDRDVAVKVLREGPLAGPGDLARFRREAVAAAALHHPNIVAVHEVGEADGHAFFSMDLVRGPTLAEVARDGPVEPNRAAGWVRSIAEALAAAHAQGILHRDLKPSNVLLGPDDEPRVTDFGLAKRLQTPEQTVTEQIAGSPAYMPPEQANPERGPVSVAADIYSLGALLYHLLTGRPPFQGESLGAILLQVANVEPLEPRLLNPDLPRDLETICLKCLAKDPARRYASARILADELGRFLRREPVVARPLSSLGRLVRWCRRQPTVAALVASVALLLVALVIAATVAAWRIDRARRGEHRERERTAQANSRLSDALSFAELQRAETLFRGGDAALGLAQLAGVLRRDPTNHMAAERILSALLHRDWVMPAGELPHRVVAYSVMFSTTGQYVVSGSADQFARVWDVPTRTEIVALPHPEKVLGACFEAAGTRVATACEDGFARVWNWRTAELLLPPLHHASFALSVAFSPDGGRLAVACGDGTVSVWSTRTGQRLLCLAGHQDEVHRAMFSPDGRLIATASYDGTARVWNAETGEAAGPVLRHRARVLGVAFSPDGGRLATASRDRTAVIWDWATGLPVLPAFHHPDGLNDVQFDPAGLLLVTTGFDSTVRLWDASSGALVSQPFRHREQVNQASFSPDGCTLVTARDDSTSAGDESTVRFWDVQPSRALVEPLRPPGASNEVNWAELSPEGARVLTASSDGTVWIWDAASGEAAGAPLRHAAPVLRAAFSPDGRFIATGCKDGSAWIWDARTGNPVAGPLNHGAPISSVEFSPDGRRLVTASDDGNARVWNRESLAVVLLPHAGGVTVARFSPDGLLIVTASHDKTARVWNAESGVPVSPPLVHGDKVQDACFSPDSRLVATASMDNAARVWNARSGESLRGRLEHARTVESVAFSPDGQRVVTASLDHTARVWDVRTGWPLTPPMEHDEAVICAAFSPDGRRIVTAARDRMVRIWDAAAGWPLSEPLEHRAPLKTARFTPDGERLLTVAAAPDNAARLWPVPAAPEQVPAWLAPLAEAVAGLSLGPQGTVRLVPETDLDELRQRVGRISAGDNFDRVAGWFFAERTARPLSPFHSLTRAAYVQRRIAENTRSSLEEALRLEPTNIACLSRLARATLGDPLAPEPFRHARAACLARRALLFSPGLKEAREVLDECSR